MKSTGIGCSKHSPDSTRRKHPGWGWGFRLSSALSTGWAVTWGSRANPAKEAISGSNFPALAEGRYWHHWGARRGTPVQRIPFTQEPRRNGGKSGIRFYYFC